MSEQKKREKEMQQHIDDSVFKLFEGAVAISVNVKMITSCLNGITDNEYDFTQYNQITFIEWVLILRRNMAHMNFITSQFVPCINEESNKIYKTVLDKLEAAEAKEDEFRKIYKGVDAKKLTPEDFLKYLKE